MFSLIQFQKSSTSAEETECDYANIDGKTALNDVTYQNFPYDEQFGSYSDAIYVNQEVGEQDGLYVDESVYTSDEIYELPTDLIGSIANESNDSESISQCSSSSNLKAQISSEEDPYLPMTLHPKTQELKMTQPQSSNQFGTLGRKCNDPLPKPPVADVEGLSIVNNKTSPQGSQVDSPDAGGLNTLKRNAKVIRTVKPRNGALQALSESQLYLFIQSS